MQVWTYVKQYTWCNGIVTTCFKTILWYVKISTKSRVTPKVLIIYQKYLFKLMPKPISKFPKVVNEEFVNEENLSEIITFCFSYLRHLAVAKEIQDKI